jgi:hypothetical protein
MCKNIPFSSSNSRSQYQHQGRITCEWVRDTIQPQKDCRLHSYSSFWPLRVSFLRGSSKLPLDHVPRFHRIVCLLHTGRGVLLARHARPRLLWRGCDGLKNRNPRSSQIFSVCLQSLQSSLNAFVYVIASVFFCFLPSVHSTTLFSPLQPLSTGVG